jgi:hypothetical protein
MSKTISSDSGELELTTAKTEGDSAPALSRSGAGERPRKSEIDRKYKTSPHGAERRRLQRAERRKNDPQYREKLRAQWNRHALRCEDKARARRLMAHAIHRGKIVRGSCEICGATGAQAHHDDYLNPLKVTWLCFKHHREVAHGQRVYAT